MKKYKVDVFYTKRGSVTFIVSARDQEEAKEKISEWEYDGVDYDDTLTETELEWDTAEFEVVEKVK